MKQLKIVLAVVVFVVVLVVSLIIGLRVDDGNIGCACSPPGYHHCNNTQPGCYNG